MQFKRDLYSHYSKAIWFLWTGILGLNRNFILVIIYSMCIIILEIYFHKYKIMQNVQGTKHILFPSPEKEKQNCYKTLFIKKVYVHIEQ